MWCVLPDDGRHVGRVPGRLLLQRISMLVKGVDERGVVELADGLLRLLLFRRLPALGHGR